METRNEQIVRLYSSLLTLARMIVDDTDAEDVVHDAIVYILNLDASKLTTDAWIRRLVINRSLNCLRNKGLRSDREGGFLDETHTDGGLTPEDVLLLSEKEDALHQLLSHLDPEQYSVIQLLYGFDNRDEHTVRRAANALKLAPSTVHDRHHGVLHLLRYSYNV